MKTNPKSKRGFTLVELLVVIVIIAALAGLAVPQLIRMKKKADLADTINNARQIGLSLAQFDADIGGYPDNSTIDAIKTMTGDNALTGLSGDDSNAYFKQLIKAGVTDSEQPFFAKTSYSKSKPDDITSPDSSMLEGGEVGFGYIMKDSTTSLSIVSGRPICVSPLQEGSSEGKFEIDPYDSKGVVLFTDSSVRQLTIRKSDDELMLSGGKTLLDAETPSIWDSLGSVPVIKPPLPKAE